MFRYKFSGLLLVAALLSACHHQEHGHEAEEHDNEHSHEGEIVMCPTEQKANGVVAVKVKPGTFSEVLHTSGRITASPQGQVQVSAPLSGVVTGLRLNAGREVSAGTQLLTITSPGQQSQSAQAELDAARTSLERLERLAPDRLVGADELEAARARMKQAEIAVQYNSFTVKVPASGTLQSLAVANGQMVETGDVLATVATRGQGIQLEALIPGHRLLLSDRQPTYTSARFKAGQQTGVADISVGMTVQLDADGCVRATFAGFTASAPIGAYCEVWLMGAERDGVISLPHTALTEDQGVHYVFVKEHSDSFRRQAVTLGQSDGERVEILSGVKDGDVVVTEGTYAVRAAGQTAAIPGHSHNH